MVAAVGAAAAVGGALITSNATSNAARGQQQSAEQANALQLQMFQENNRLAAPALNTGNAARDRLSYLLGLSPTGFSGTGGAPGTSSTQPNTYEQLRAQLLPQFTTSQAAPGSTAPGLGASPEAALAWQQANATPLGVAPLGAGLGPGQWMPGSGDTPQWVAGNGGPTSTVNEAGLDAAIRAQLAQQEQAQAAAEAAARANPEYGRLAQGFQFQTYTPQTFSYTGSDLYSDPSYLFRLEQGQKALDRQGAAAGRFLSGGQLQATSNYNQGAASQEFQNAYGRALGTFNTNEGNRFGAFQANEGNRYNAFQTNFANTVNPLLALSGAGQLASTQLMGNNTQYASTTGNNLMGAANASGAAAIAGANTINNGISNAVQGYQTNQLLQRYGGSLNSNPGVFPNNPIG